MRILAVDPGKSTGWAVINTQEKKLEIFGTQNTPETFYRILTVQDDVDLYVVEDYKVRPAQLNKGWMHQWNDGIALQIIGAIKFLAWDRNIDYVLQQPVIKPSGYGFIGAEYKKGKANMHHMDAIAHGFYYCVKNKLLTPNDLRTMFSDSQ